MKIVLIIITMLVLTSCSQKRDTVVPPTMVYKPSDWLLTPVVPHRPPSRYKFKYLSSRDRELELTKHDINILGDLAIANSKLSSMKKFFNSITRKTNELQQDSKDK